MSNPHSQDPANHPMFDEALALRMQAAMTDALQAHPDVLRSIGVFFDYRGGLNQSQVIHGLWLGASGSVVAADAIVGSAESCLQLLSQILQRGYKLQQAMEQQLLAVSRDLQQKTLEHARLTSEIESFQQQGEAGRETR